MLNRLQKIKSEQSNKGFTIIEVMIVLAIAGLIILIVLLAVPALQRNARNTAIKNDASAIAGAVTEFLSNNDGQAPTAGGSAQAGAVVTINNANGTAATAKVQGNTVVTFVSAAAAQTPVAGGIIVDYGYKCPATGGAATAVTPVANSRGTVVIYAVETTGANSAKCIDS